MDSASAFWAKVEKTADCWLWRGSLTMYGYGQFWERTSRKTWRAHRFAYITLTGGIPDGLILDHLCRVKHCVNPDHLEPVTNRENVKRGLAAVKKLHCKRGHQFNSENTYLRSNGVRQCRECVRYTQREWKATKRTIQDRISKLRGER